MPTPRVTSPSDTFPRQMARTARFSLGVPRAFTVSQDGQRVVFLRSRSGTDRTGLLWSLDVTTGEETLLVDPASLLETQDEALSPEERARRERLREGGAGVTSYATDQATTTAAFALSSRLFTADLRDGTTRELPAAGAVIDPRVSPDGRWVTYVATGGLHVVATDGTGGHPLAESAAASETWGLAEFVASEELGRYRGHWWLPDSEGLLVAHVDNSPVQTWWVADPAHPESQPHPHRYPAAGTNNAEVRLWRVALDGSRTELAWDREAFPYLVDVHVTADDPGLVLVMDRRQGQQQVLAVDPAEPSGLRILRELRDDAWVDVIPGSPTWWDGQLVTVEVSDDTYRLCLDGQPFSPIGLQVRGILNVTDEGLVVAAHHDPVERRVVLLRADGALTELGPADALVAGTREGGTTVLRTETLDSTGPSVTVTHGGSAVEINSLAEDPGFTPRARLVPGPYDGARTVVLLPTGWSPADGPLPVILSPYGGPHAAMVVHAGRAYLEEQWIADQGFAVVVADGHGTPGSPSWEREMRLDVATPALEGQVRGLEAAARAYPEAVDLSRVGIRGWSFGGYLAALAVLKRPDVFHAAVAGAPPSDWALYDTAYTERYLGLPTEQPEVYEATSLLPLAPLLERPLLIIHGLADDNVVVAHSLRLSRALLEAGRPHQVLPLSGVTHMTPQEVVTENILRLELAFLRQALGEAGA